MWSRSFTATSDITVNAIAFGTTSTNTPVSSNQEPAVVDVVEPTDFDLSIQMVAPLTVTSDVCPTLPYTLNVTNVGNDQSSSPIVTDVLPPQVSFASVTTTSGTCGFSNGTVTCQLADLPPAATASIVITTVPQIPSGTIANSASVTSSSSDGNPSNDVDSKSTVVSAPSIAAWQQLTSSFNSTSIPPGRTLWFTAVMKVSGLSAPSTTIAASNGVITYSAGGTNYSIVVPRARVTFKSGLKTAAVDFDQVKNEWVTVVPTSFAGNAFFAAVAVPVSSNLPGGITPVSWSTYVTSNQPGVSVTWAWSAATYSTFNANYNLLGVQPIDDRKYSPFRNSDKAGTPESFKAYLRSGARAPAVRTTPVR